MQLRGTNLLVWEYEAVPYRQGRAAQRQWASQISLETADGTMKVDFEAIKSGIFFAGLWNSARSKTLGIYI